MSSRPRVLVTGGAGYIGSHAAVALHEAGFMPVLLDNLSHANRMAVDGVRELCGAPELPFHAVDEDELDRILGTIWEYVERYWRTALKMGFARQLKDKPEKNAE